ncbi:NUDIX hydrolase [Pseudoxanthobacter sp.]|uniref:NUDIX hydrolase n=1 Tax=Pseudoxanthobacter sp. TaxID=1925742 RepID=UPI002FE097BC
MGQTTDKAVRPVAAVLAIVARQGRVLLVRRANPPDQGLWGFPGGRIEPGETAASAAERELAEETGVSALAEGPVGLIDVIGHDGDGALAHHFVLVAIGCRWQAGEPVAGDDALEAGWFSLADVEGGLLQTSARVSEFARRALGA